MTQIDENAAEAVFQRFKYVKPRLNRAAFELICSAYEEEKAPRTISRDEFDVACDAAAKGLFEKENTLKKAITNALATLGITVEGE